MPSATIGRRCTPASRLPSGMPNSRLNVRTLVEQALSELTEYAKAIARASSATLLRSTLNKQTKSDPTAQAMLITLLRSVGRHLRDAIMNPMTAEAAIRLRWLRCSAGHQRKRQSKNLPAQVQDNLVPCSTRLRIFFNRETLLWYSAIRRRHSAAANFIVSCGTDGLPMLW